MKLTDRKLIGIEHRDKPYDIREQDCFVVRINKKSITFQYVPRIDGKEKRIKIGRYPAMSLAEAREKHRELIRKKERGELDKPQLTYAQVYESYINKNKSSYADNGGEFRRIHEKDILPYISNILITELRKTDILPISDSIVKRGSPRQANITVEKISRVCRYAVELDLIPYNIVDNYPKETESEPRQRTLTTDEIKELHKNRKRSDADKILWLMLITGQRGGEIKNINCRDIRGNWWYCEQRKGNKTSVKAVYLTHSALKLIGNGFTLSRKTKLSTHVKRKYPGATWTPHDIRRTASTLLVDELEMSDALVDRWLGHGVPKIKSTYIVSKRLKEMRVLTVMLNWHIRKL